MPKAVNQGLKTFLDFLIKEMDVSHLTPRERLKLKITSSRMGRLPKVNQMAIIQNAQEKTEQIVAQAQAQGQAQS